MLLNDVCELLCVQYCEFGVLSFHRTLVRVLIFFETEQCFCYFLPNLFRSHANIEIAI